MGYFRSRAVEEADVIIAKAKKEVDNDALIKRLEESMESNAKKDGLRFMLDQKSDYHAFRMFGENFGIGIGVFQTDDSKMKFRVSTCFCIPEDFENGGWDDEFALSLLGMRLATNEWEPMEFPRKVELHVVVKAVHAAIVHRAYIGDPKIPFFLKRALWTSPEDVYFRAKRISK
jgi:hypothetical protein